MDHADDTTLFGETADELRETLSMFAKETKKLGLQTNWSKTKLMDVGNGPDLPPFLFDGTPIHFVSTFKYFDSTVPNYWRPQTGG